MIRVGVAVYDFLLTADPEARLRPLRLASALGLDHLGLADHVSFHDGTGFDGLISAAVALGEQQELPVVLGVYLLGLRHPTLVARQLASIGQLAPGRMVLGVGVAGEDRSEVSNSGVDPSTRGRRLDETLEVLRLLSAGKPVTHDGEFFSLDEALVLPAPDPAVPIVIGGRGDVAVRRTARYGDGWLGIFCSARRFAQTRQDIVEAAAELGRDAPDWFGLTVWCGLDTDAGHARDLLVDKMERLYRLPFDRFEHVATAGTPDQVAEWLAPFVAAGASHITIIPATASIEAGIEHVAAVRELLVG